MHRAVVPKRSGIHRLACLALYRALLRQCRYLPDSIPNSSAAKQLIPKKFHKYKRLDSPSQIANSLKAGYEALDLLHSASQGNQRDVYRVATLIPKSESIRTRDTPRQRKMTKAKQAIPPTESQKRRDAAIRQQKMTARRYPNAPSILERPRPVVRGKRRIPAFVNARGVPMLRIKRVQPMFLSGVIRSKLNRREHYVEVSRHLKQDLLFGADEDLWDKLTAPQERISWAQEIRDAIGTLRRKTKEMDVKNSHLAKDMWNVVLRERELAAKEEMEGSSEK